MHFSPGKYDLTIYRGDTRRWQFVLWADPDAQEPLDLTNVIVDAQIQTAQSPVVTLACTVIPTGTETNPIMNTVDVYLSAKASKTLIPSKGHWDLQLTYSNGEVSTVIAGNVLITGDVTLVGGNRP